MTIKKIFCIIFCIMISLSFSIISQASTSLEVDTFDVDVQVDKNAVLQVEETITFQGQAPKTINRYIQQEYIYDVHKDGNAKKYAYQIDKITAEGADVSMKRLDDQIQVQLACDEDASEVTLHYQVRMRNFGDKEKTIFLYQLLSSQDNMNINNVTMQIHLANRPDTNFLIYEIDANGNPKDFLTYQLQDKTISLQLKDWKSHTGIVVSAALRPFYFQYSNPITYHFFAIIFSIILVMGTYIWNMKKSNKRTSQNCSFDIFEESFVTGSYNYVIDGFVSTSDIVSILLNWANQGWMEIYDDGHDVMLFMKQPLPQDCPFYEHQLLTILFEQRNEMSLLELEKRCISSQITEIKQELQKYLMKQQPSLYINTLSRSQYVFAAVVGLPMLFAFFACGYELTYRISTGLIYGTVAYVIVIVNALLWVIGLRFKYSFKKKAFHVTRILAIGCNGITGILFYVFLLKQGTPMVYVIMQLILTLLFGSMLLFTEKLTKHGMQQRDKLLAFCDVLKYFDMEQYHQLYEKYPYLYQEVLPYAYVFDIVPIVSQKVANMKIPAPKWYYHECSSYLSSYYWATNLYKTLQRIEMVLHEQKQEKNNHMTESIIKTDI